MAKPSAPPPLVDTTKQALEMLTLNPMLAPQIEHFWKAQQGLLTEIEAFSKAWFAHRQDAAQSALTAIQGMDGTRADPGTGLEVMTQWQRDTLERMAADMQCWMRLCAGCAGQMIRAETHAAEDAMAETAKRTKAATDTEHATPV